MIHQLHLNSLRAWQSLDPRTRKRQVCDALNDAGRALTDREVCTRLGKADMNYARPAITALVQDGTLAEVGDTIDDTTGRTVRRVWFAGGE